MHVNTQKVLNDLKAMGIDTSAIETQLATNTTADNYLGAGITRTQEFTTIIGEKRRIESQFNEVKEQLAAMQNQMQGGNLNPATITALDTRVKALKNFLITEGEYNETEVNKIFADIETDIAASLKNPNSPSTSTSTQTQNQTGNPMTKEELEALQTRATVGGAALGFGLNFQFNRALLEFNSLYGRFPNDAEISQLESALTTRTMQGNESVAVVAADIFKFDAKKTEIATNQLNEKLAAAKAEGKAEAITEMGNPNAPRGGRVTSRAPISRHFSNGDSNKSGARVTAGINPNTPQIPDNSGTPNPNPNPEVMPFQQRGNAASRLRHMNAVVASKPEVFDEFNYTPVYGSESNSGNTNTGA